MWQWQVGNRYTILITCIYVREVFGICRDNIFVSGKPNIRIDSISGVCRVRILFCIPMIKTVSHVSYCTHIKSYHPKSNNNINMCTDMFVYGITAASATTKNNNNNNNSSLESIRMLLYSHYLDNIFNNPLFVDSNLE